MTTMRELVNRTRTFVSGSLNEPLNLLAAPYTPGDDQITLALPSNAIGAGMILSCDLCVFQVTNYTQASGVVNVIPSPNGEPDVALPAGSRVRVKPRFTDWLIFKNLNDQIVLMSSSANGLYTTLTWTATVDPAWNTYRIPDTYPNVMDVIRVRHKVVGSPDMWTDLRHWTVQFNVDGGAIVRNFERDIQFGEMEFVAKVWFTPATDLDTVLEDDCKVPTSMVDIPFLGAAGYLLASGEAQRLQQRVQGEGRRPTELPVESSASMANNLLFRRDRRIAEEFARLQQHQSFQRGRW